MCQELHSINAGKDVSTYYQTMGEKVESIILSAARKVFKHLTSALLYRV